MSILAATKKDASLKAEHSFLERSRQGRVVMSHVYEVITERILGKLEQGIVPWHKPWEQGIPRNLVTKKPYRGVNVFLTGSAGFASPYWLTLKRLCLKSLVCD